MTTATRVKVTKDYDGKWTAYNRSNGKCAEIIRISEYSLLPTSTKYRVDVNGRTVDSMIEHFQTAKSVAIKQIQ